MVRGESSTIAASTSAPPATWTGVSAWPNRIHASAAATSGSNEDRIDAVPDPMRRSATRKAVSAPTVETVASSPTWSQPAAEMSRWSWPVAAPKPVRETPAPLKISPARRNGSIRSSRPSVARTKTA